MTPERRQFYRQGYCDAMALALHRLTGLPLVKIVGLKRNTNPIRKRGDDWCEEPAHIAVKAGKLWLDVDGLHDEIPKLRLTWLRKPDRIAIRPSSVEEATYLYSMGGVTEDEIDAAVKDALEDPKLAQIISRFGRARRATR